MYFIDAVAGSGKSYWIKNQAKKMAEDGEKVLVAAPTKRLIDIEFAPFLKSECLMPVMAIHSDSVDGPAVKAIKNEIFGTDNPDPYADGSVLLITQSSLERLGEFDRGNFNLLVDEIPPIFDHFEEIMPKTHSILTGYLKLGCEGYPYREIEVIDEVGLRKFAAVAQEDKGYAAFRDISQRLLSPDWKSYALLENFNGLLNGDKRFKKLTIDSVLQPSIFDGYRSVHVAGAHFEQSLLHQSWTKLGVNFTEHDKSALRYSQHNGEHLTIYFATDRPWSKTLALSNKIHPVLNRLAAFFKSHVGELPFIYSQNKGNPLYPDLPQELMIPYSPFGLNNLTHIDNAILLASRNPKPSQIAFIIDYLGVSPDKISAAIHKEIVYQNVMRCSLRDPNNNNSKRIYVPDRDTAEWLAEEFPGARLEQLDSGIPELASKIRSTRHARTAAERQDKRRAKLRLQKFQNYSGPNDPIQTLQKKFGWEFSLNEENVTKFRGSVFAKVNSMRRCGMVKMDSLEEFETFLKEWFECNFVEKKQDNKLISAAYFDHEIGETSRGLDNVLFCSGIFLDFDGGELGPVEFGEVFDGIRATTYSSFSSVESEKRFRAYIPISKAMSAQDYKTLVAALEWRLNQRGYFRRNECRPGFRTHNLDKSKMNAASLFYLPCQPAHPSADYHPHFKIWNEKNRAVLDPEQMIDSFVSGLASNDDSEQWNDDDTLVLNDEYKRRGVEMAVAAWQSDCQIASKGNDNFYLLGFRLLRAGCTYGEIESMLNRESYYAVHPDQRTKQIPSILTSLRSRGVRLPQFTIA